MKAVAYSPAHVTGLFEICDDHADLLFKGSRGAGISIQAGVVTRVKLETSGRPGFLIKIGGSPTSPAPVSESVLRRFLARVRESYFVEVEHDVQVPIGSGFGTSGAAALSLALALNGALGLGLNKTEAAQVAHVAEVECRTGLGAVISELFGGLEVRIRPGAPGIGELRKIQINGDYTFTSLHFGPISTPKLLGDPELIHLINGVGRRLLDRLMPQPTPELFMKISEQFTESVGLFTDRMKPVMMEAEKIGHHCAMAMFGETVFTLIKANELKEIIRIFGKYSPYGMVITSAIELDGARVI